MGWSFGGAEESRTLKSIVPDCILSYLYVTSCHALNHLFSFLITSIHFCYSYQISYQTNNCTHSPFCSLQVSTVFSDDSHASNPTFGIRSFCHTSLLETPVFLSSCMPDFCRYQACLESPPQYILFCLLRLTPFQNSFSSHSITFVVDSVKVHFEILPTCEIIALMHKHLNRRARLRQYLSLCLIVSIELSHV